jgi:hypothetical protein
MGPNAPDLSLRPRCRTLPSRHNARTDREGLEAALGGVACAASSSLDLVPIAGPPGVIARWKVGPAGISPDGAVDQLAQDVGVACVTLDIGNHVNQRSVKRKLP